MDLANQHPVDIAHTEEATFGEKVADSITSGMGSWRFIIAQAVFTTIWIILNSIHGWGLMWDNYPFVLLNLVYSFQAGFTGPILLLSSNRQAKRDRALATHTYDILKRLATAQNVDVSDME